MRTPAPPGAHRDHRPCWRCERTLHKTQFPFGRSGKRRSAVCWRCTEEEAHAVHERLTEWRATYIVDAKTGAQVRRCPACEEVKPLDAEHFYPRGSEAGFMSLCKPCGTTSAKHYAKPRDKAKAKATRQRYLKKLKADPKRHARYLEDRRIAHHLKREREGQALDATPRSSKATMNSEKGRRVYLPSAPLIALIERIVDQRAETARILNDPSGVGPEAVCEDLGVSSRNLRRWRNGEQPNVRVGTAEAVLMAAGVEWHEVYSYDDHAAIFLADEVPV